MPAIVPAVNPNKLTGLGRWLVRVGAELTSLVLTDFYTDGVGTVDLPEEAEWRRVTVRYSRQTPIGTEEDYALFGMDIVNMTGGSFDSSWTTGDYTAVDNALGEFLTTLRASTYNSHTIVDAQYHVRKFTDDIIPGQAVPQMYTDPKTQEVKEKPRFQPSGPPVHVLPIGQSGSAGVDPSAYQNACSVTFRTAAKGHWGRCYLPGITMGGAQEASGRRQIAVCQAVANAFAEFSSDLGANDFYLKVAMTQHAKKYEFALSAVNEIVVDDVPDVIRRRRPRQAKSYQIGVATP